jgi:hypothetical protein
VVGQHAQVSLHLVAIGGLLVAQVTREALPAARKPQPPATTSIALVQVPAAGRTAHHVSAPLAREPCNWSACCLVMVSIL